MHMPEVYSTRRTAFKNAWFQK